MQCNNVKIASMLFIFTFLCHHTMLPWPPEYLPLFIRILWDNKDWKKTCESLETNDQYKELKAKIGSDIEKLVLSTDVAKSLLEDGKVVIHQENEKIHDSDIIDELEIQLKLNNFLIEQNFEHFEPMQEYYLSKVDGKMILIRSLEKNLSQCLFVGQDKERAHLSPVETDELLMFIENSGYVYRENMAEDKQTHRLHNWYYMSSDDFKHTHKLTALADFARKIDPDYGTRGYYKKRSILDKEGISKLKTRIFELTKKCLFSDPAFTNEDCIITPLSKRELPK